MRHKRAYTDRFNIETCSIKMHYTLLSVPIKHQSRKTRHKIVQTIIRKQCFWHQADNESSTLSHLALIITQADIIYLSLNKRKSTDLYLQNLHIKTYELKHTEFCGIKSIKYCVQTISIQKNSVFIS